MVTQDVDGTVYFSFYRPDACSVSLVGDFNGWQKSFQMKRENGGWWVSRLRLAPGTYQFKYLADGQWFVDYAAFGVEHGPFGVNSVVCVEEPEWAALPEAAASQAGAVRTGSSQPSHALVTA